MSDCDIQVITSERLRLDQPQDMLSLNETVAVWKPRLLILDPFVRLHCIDENSSHEVALILQNLRVTQRRYKTAVLVVHHAKKNGGSHRAGQALRGSSEFHAWGDSNLYIRRSADELSLTIEHRAAPSQSNIPVFLKSDGDKLSLEIKADTSEPSSETLDPVSRIEKALSRQLVPVSLCRLRDICGIRMETLSKTIKSMVEAGSVQRTAAGYELIPVSLSADLLEDAGNGNGKGWCNNPF